MATHRRWRLMHRESDRALGAPRHVPACGALHECRKAAAIEQQKDLLAALQRAGDRLVQRYAPRDRPCFLGGSRGAKRWTRRRSEEHTSELQSQSNLVCRLLLE